MFPYEKSGGDVARSISEKYHLEGHLTFTGLIININNVMLSRHGASSIESDKACYDGDDK